MKRARAVPRFSLNKLGEYLAASAVRRKSIVKDQKYPATFIVARYTEAKQAMIDVLCSPEQADDILQQAIETIKCKDEDSDWTSEIKRSQTAAILSFWKMFAEDHFPSDLRFSRATNENSIIQVSGLEVSTSVDLLVTKGLATTQKFGLLKLHISKTNQLNADQMDNVGAFLVKYASELGYENISSQAVYTVDVFGQSVKQAPKSITQRVKNMEAACEEIVLRWASV